MQSLTPPQLQQLQSWAEKRDAILGEIRNFSIELEGLQKATTEQGQNLAALHVSIGEARGRLAELDALEQRVRTSLPNDISELEVRKSRLQGECVLLEEKAKSSTTENLIVSMATADLEKAHVIMKDQAAIVNRVVGEIITTSQVHTSEMKTIMAEVRTIAAEVIEKGNANIAQANSLAETVPLFVAKLQKSIAAPRKYPEGHPRFVKTD